MGDIPVTVHPLPIGTAVSFPPRSFPSIRRPPGLQTGTLVCLTGRIPRGLGVIQAVRHVKPVNANELTLERIVYVIQAADGEVFELAAIRVSRAPLLEVLAASAQGARYDGQVGEDHAS